jgi:sulfur-oxidizing protein SoxY
MHKRLLGGDPFQFDQRVKVIAPTDAEDPMNVPVLVDASALGSVRRIVVFAELNPIQKILEMEPLRAEARVGIRIKVQQATPVRAAALTEDGVWHVGGQIVEAAGGGCTAPSVGSANADWASRLGEVTGRLWQRPDGTRVRLRIMHPMDTGLGGGIPAFYIEELALEDSDGEVLTRLAMFEPVAENPVLTIDLPKTDHVALQARDNNGNPVFARILAGDKGR